MRTATASLAICLFAGCADTTTQCCLVQHPYLVQQPQPVPQPPPPPQPVVTPPAEEPCCVAALPGSRVLVLQSTHTDRLTEVVGVIDVHAEMGGHDAALEMLKARAERMGADAVLGVEFHHGHGEEEPTHLSGLAVRFIDGVR